MTTELARASAMAQERMRYLYTEDEKSNRSRYAVNNPTRAQGTQLKFSRSVLRSEDFCMQSLAILRNVARIRNGSDP